MMGNVGELWHLDAYTEAYPVKGRSNFHTEACLVIFVKERVAQSSARWVVLLSKYGFIEVHKATFYKSALRLM